MGKKQPHKEKLKKIQINEVAGVRKHMTMTIVDNTSKKVASDFSKKILYIIINTFEVMHLTQEILLNSLSLSKTDKCN